VIITFSLKPFTTISKKNYLKTEQEESQEMNLCHLLISIILFPPPSATSLKDQSVQFWGRTQHEFAFANQHTNDSNLGDNAGTPKEDVSKLLAEGSEMIIDKLPSIASDISPNLPPRVIIIGGPASGKGTQCEYISSKYGLIHLSTGEILREAVRKKNGMIGRIAKQYMDLGELVPDEVIIKIVGDRLKEDDCQRHGWLLDGFPRTKTQAEYFSKMGITADMIVVLNVPDNELIDRVTGRRIDPVTGKIYHMKHLPPPSDIIKNRLIQRNDDTSEKMKLRLRKFHEHLSLIRMILANSTPVVDVNGLGSPEVIAMEISAAIGSKVGYCNKAMV